MTKISRRTITSAAQKLKGKAQKAIGAYQTEKGEVVKGGISKIKGRLNEAIADAKLSWENRNDRNRSRLEDYDEIDEEVL